MTGVDNSKQHPDEYWKNNLSQKEYETLRLGKMEEPNVGKFVHTGASGRYYCRGCKSYLFHSTEKTDDDSGYATFKVYGESEGVRLERSYTQTGDERTTPVCRACGGKLGEAAGIELRSADNLEQGTQERLVHINSSALFIKKNFTIRNYPFAYFLIIASLIGGALFAWSWAGNILSMAENKNIEDALHLWVGENEVYAKTIHVEEINPEEQSFVFGEGVLFVVLPTKADAPQLKIPETSIDIVWLDKNFAVIKKEVGLYSEFGDEMLTYEEGATYALITRPGYFKDGSAEAGSDVVVVDKTQLF